MKKFIPYEKLSKKERRKLDLTRRQTWGQLSPVTRKPQNSKAYNRRKSQDWKNQSWDLFILLLRRHNVGQRKIGELHLRAFAEEIRKKIFHSAFHP